VGLFLFCSLFNGNICIASGYGMDDRGVRVRVPVGVRIITSPCHPRPALGPTQPTIQWVRGAFSLRIKRPWREADHSTPTSSRSQEYVDLYILHPVQLHGIVLYNFKFSSHADCLGSSDGWQRVMNWKEYGRKRSWRNLKYCPASLLGWLKKTSESPQWGEFVSRPIEPLKKLRGL
jgi:hypothetical protein